MNRRQELPNTKLSLLITALVSLALAACLENSKTPSGKSAAAKAAASKAGTSTNSSFTESQCLIFKNNTNDYLTCVSCKESLCPCLLYSTDGSTCLEKNVATCSVSDTSLAQCVHNNVAGAGGACSSGLNCAANQVPDFAACACRDATPPTSIGPQPGFEDQSAPYMEPGFYISNRYCAPPTVDIAGVTETSTDCLLTDGATNNTTYVGTFPKHTTQSPRNVFQDVGYVRWDLALDASQYPQAIPLLFGQPFLGTTSTLVGNLSVSYQLKPNTVLSLSTSPRTITWNDCVEHFSGSTPTGAGSGLVSTNNMCSSRSGVTTDPGTAAAIEVDITGTESSGIATLKALSMNGSSANANMTLLGNNGTLVGNPRLRTSITDTGTFNTLLGVGKRDNGAVGGAFTDQDAGVGLVSNIGYYKYSWGPLSVKRKATDPAAIASASVSGLVAMNVNLGYTPVSAVESTALSPFAVMNTISTRDCTDTNIIPNQCAVTAVYRSSGGSVLSQTFSPSFPNHASGVTPLPSGIVAVSTPKIVEDTSQAAISTTLPAKLRVFARADDGNIYMSKNENSVWGRWLNLGRPWICDSTDASTSPLCGTSLITTPLYRPFVPTGATLLDPYAPSGTKSVNNGLSIAGEPMVVSYMDTTVSPVVGYIMIFVRVSQMRSTLNDTDPTVPSHVGPYHNAVFYTVAVTSGTGSNRSFDEVMNWQTWLPVVDTANNLLRIQGNPLVFLSNASGSIRAHVFGTQAEDDFSTAGGVPRLLPPIAPNAAANLASAGGATLDSAGYTVATGYYNYGTAIVRTSLALAAYAGGAYPTSVPLATPWVAIDADDYGFPITTDWTHAFVSGLTNRIRVFANSIAEVAPPNAPATTGRGPGQFSKNLLFTEFDLDVGGTATSVCNGTYAGMRNFYGNIWPMNVSTPMGAATAPTSPGTDSTKAYRALPLNANVNANGDNRMFLFGRATCPFTSGAFPYTGSDTANCDVVNPSLSYISVEATTECGDAERDYVVYQYGQTRDSNGGVDTNATNFLMLAPFFPTSDVIPIYSRALAQNANSDLPVYLFARSPSGTVAHGVWGSTANAGSLLYRMFNLGGFTN